MKLVYLIIIWKNLQVKVNKMNLETKNNLETSFQRPSKTQIFFWRLKPPRSARYHSCLIQYAKLAKSNEAIWRKWPKTSILETNSPIFWRQIFFQKSGFVTFFVLLKASLMQKIKQILWLVAEKNLLLTNERTNELTTVNL